MRNYRYERNLGAMLLIVALCGLSGCATSFREYFRNGLKVGPNYCPPQAPVAEHWIDFKDGPTEPSNDPAWWRVFNDRKLDELVQTAYSQNLTLREAGFRIEEARALRAIQVGNLFPQSQTAFGQYRRQMLSLGTGITAGGGGGGGLPGVDRYFSVWNLGTQMAWELDFWGKFRRAVEASDAQLDATVENYDDVLVILIGDVASTYVEVRTVEQRLRYANANVAIQQRSFDRAKNRFESGKGARPDVAQAKTNVAQTQSTIPALEIQLRQAQNRLCVLLGIPPQNVNDMLGKREAIPSPIADIVLGVPADLVRRRPDIRRAEREVAAQSALIGVAESELYPAFTINGQIFVQANQFNDMFNSRAVGGNIGPSFNWNVFNYLRIRNAIEAEEARFMQEVAQYQTVVLNANREAEDAIVGYVESRKQAGYLQESVVAAAELVDLIERLDPEVAIDFNRVFVAELALSQQQDNLAVSQGNIAQNLVQLYRSLGGGWQLRTEGVPPFVEREVVPPPPPEMMMPRGMIKPDPPEPKPE